VEITLTPETEAIIQAKMETGLYHSPSEIVHEAIRRMDEDEAAREHRREDIRRKVAHAEAQAERGELYSFASGADAMEHIKAEGQKALGERTRH
jgi:putative addiction module CopG family antidote